MMYGSNYADAAETCLNGANAYDYGTPEHDSMVARAQVYATLALACDKFTPPEAEPDQEVNQSALDFDENHRSMFDSHNPGNSAQEPG